MHHRMLFVARIAQAWNRFWFEPASPAPICLFRIAFGLLAFVNTLLYVPDFLTWFGADGAAPPEVMGRVAWAPLLGLLIWLDLSNQAYAWLLCVFMVAQFCVVVGFRTRLSTFVVWILLNTFHQRNPSMWHQVDILLRLWCFALLFAPAGAMYSVDSYLRKKPADPSAPWAQRLIQVQMCAIYVQGFFGKLAGPRWLDGTAVYYATHFPDGMHNLVPPFMDHLWIYQALTYFTLLIEFSLWCLVWYRPLRYPILVAGVIFHLGIHYFLNLDLLEFGIIICYICFLNPEDFRSKA